jgi:hypothetical protein
MTEKATNAQQGEAQTTWRRRTASFEDAVQAGWRSYRLVPWLFKRAGRVEPVDVLEAFGGAQLYATTDFSLERGFGIDGLGKEWGASIARAETTAFIAKLVEQCAATPGSAALAHDLYGALGRIGGGGDSVAILAPSRGRVLRQLQLERPSELPWLPGAGARSLLRGTFEGVPVFAAQPADATDFWVVDFGSVGYWEYAGEFDGLMTRADLLRDQLVEAGGTRDLATRITADEYFSIAIETPAAAHGVRIPLEAAG